MSRSGHAHAPDHPDHPHEHDDADPALWTAAYWDERYGGSSAVWSGRPNQRLVEQVAGLAPGTALDVGCGEGADAVWLATQGWTVTGVDVSGVALDRSREHAAAAGVQVDWRRVDVMAGEPLPAPYDLVSAQFLHPPAALHDRVVRALGDAVAPGGTLLVVGHHPHDLGLRQGGRSSTMMTPERVLGAVDPGAWEVRVADVQAREQVVDGRPATVHDTVVRLLRIG